MPAAANLYPQLRPSIVQRDRVWFDRRLAPLYVVIAAQLAFLVAAVRSGAFSFEPEPLTGAGVAVAGLAAVAMAARRLSFTVLADLAEAAALFFAVAILTPLCAVVLASSNLPLADGLLASLDARLRFDRRVFTAYLASHPPALSLAGFAYDSLNWQPFVLFVVLYAAKRSDRAWTFLFAWCVALVITVLIFPLIPALGGPPSDLAWARVLRHARTGGVRSLGAASLTGIVTFPSFHAAAAVLLGWAFASLSRLGAPFVVLNAVMFMSAIPAGGHYLVDLIAGGVVAAVSIRVAAKVMPLTR